jgi:hypothetical protein
VRGYLDWGVGKESFNVVVRYKIWIYERIVKGETVGEFRDGTENNRPIFDSGG